MGRAHTHGAIQVMVIAMLVSIFFVGEIRSSFPGSVPTYCVLNPTRCISNGGQTLKRQLKKVQFGLHSYNFSIAASFVSKNYRSFTLSFLCIIYIYNTRLHRSLNRTQFKRNEFFLFIGLRTAPKFRNITRKHE